MSSFLVVKEDVTLITDFGGNIELKKGDQLLECESQDRPCLDEDESNIEEKVWVYSPHKTKIEVSRKIFSISAG